MHSTHAHVCSKNNAFSVQSALRHKSNLALPYVASLQDSFCLGTFKCGPLLCCHLLACWRGFSFQTKRFYYIPVIACHFISQKKFCKKGVIVVTSVLHTMKVKCDLLHQKIFFSWYKKSRVSYIYYSLLLFTSNAYPSEPKIDCMGSAK